MTDDTPKKKDGHVGDSPRMARAYADLRKGLRTGEDPLFWDWRANQRPLSVEERRQRVQAFAEAERAKSNTQGETGVEPAVTGQWFGPSITEESNPRNGFSTPKDVIDAEVRTNTPCESFEAKRQREFRRRIPGAVALTLAAALLCLAVYFLGRGTESRVRPGVAGIASTVAVATVRPPGNHRASSDQPALEATAIDTSAGLPIPNPLPPSTDSFPSRSIESSRSVLVPRATGRGLQQPGTNLPTTRQPLPAAKPEKQVRPSEEPRSPSEDTFAGPPTF